MSPSSMDISDDHDPIQASGSGSNRAGHPVMTSSSATHPSLPPTRPSLPIGRSNSALAEKTPEEKACPPPAVFDKISIRSSYRSTESSSRQSKERKESQDRRKALYHILLAKSKTAGWRHIIMLFFISIYTVLGGAIFYAFEVPNEVQSMIANKAALEEAMRVLESDLRRIKQQNGNESLIPYMREGYIKMLNIEGKYTHSTYYKDEGNFMWTYHSACFFAMTVYTTIGYGSIAPSTDIGRVCVIFYAIIFWPLTIVVFRDLGHSILVLLTKYYAKLLIKIREAQGFKTTATEMIKLPLKFCSLLSLSYVLAATVFVYNYDAFWGPEGSGMKFFTCFYFSFLSITTIGFGDIMPSNAPFSMVYLIIFFFGLPIMRVVNRVNYISMESGLFGLFAMIHDRLSPAGDDMSKELPPTFSDNKADAISYEGCQEEEEWSENEDVERVVTSREHHPGANTLTIRSITALMAERVDVYDGNYGRVMVTKQDLQ